MTLYRTYRPQAFVDVVGQDHIVTTLEQALRKDRIGHAYLFSGTRGTGKTSVARILAKTILLKSADAERKTLIETAVAQGNLVDLIEIDAASHTGVDEIRGLIEKIGYAPSVAKAKVYIIDEVHMLSKSAFNALLKTLEEPPEYAYFILATTEREKVPDTIQSRCQQFIFRRVKDDDIIGRLQYIADQEKLSIERETLRIIAHHANGSFRDGISLLDQLQSLEKITIADVEERIGVSVHIVAEEMMSALEEMNAQHIHQLIEKSENSGFAPDLFLSTIIERLREQLHAHIERKEKIDILLSSIDQLMQGLKNVRSSPLPYLTLEATLLSIGAQEKRSDSPSQKPKEILQEEKKEEKAPIKIEQVIQEEQKPTLTQAEEFSKEMIQKHWREIIESVPIPSAKMSMKTASIRGVEGKILHLAFPSNFNKEKVEEPKARHAIEEILRQLFKQPIELRCQMETEVTPNLSMEKANLADAALEVFGSF